MNNIVTLPVASTTAGDLIVLRPFLSPQQRDAFEAGLRGEQRARLATLLAGLRQRIDAMPTSYQTNDQGDDAIAYLHYFYNRCHWYITEKDIEGGVDQAFGWSIRCGENEQARLGYISIAELVGTRLALGTVELDLYWTPLPLRVVKATYGITGGDDAHA